MKIFSNSRMQSKAITVTQTPEDIVPITNAKYRERILNKKYGKKRKYKQRTRIKQFLNISLVLTICAFVQPISASEEENEEPSTLVEILTSICKKQSKLSLFDGFPDFKKKLELDEYEDKYCTYYSEDWTDALGIVKYDENTSIFDVDQQKMIHNYFLQVTTSSDFGSLRIPLDDVNIKLKEGATNRISYKYKEESYICEIPYIDVLEETNAWGSKSVKTRKFESRLEVDVPLVNYYFISQEKEIDTTKVRNEAYEIYENRYEEYHTGKVKLTLVKVDK